jgi:transposase
LRAYFVEELPAAEVADKFGYSTRSVHQMARLLRGGKMKLFTESKPGPKAPRKVTGRLRAKVLTLRAADRSVTEISRALTSDGWPISAQTVWQILQEEGLPRPADPRRGLPGQPGTAGPGQGRRFARMAGRAGQPALRPWRAVAAHARNHRVGSA